MPAPTVYAERISGSIHKAWTWTANEYTSFVRAYMVPRKNLPAKQLAAAQLVKTLTALWKTFTPTERQAWNALARTQRLPAYTAFIGYNLQRFYKSLPAVNQPE